MQYSIVETQKVSTPENNDANKASMHRNVTMLLTLNASDEMRSYAETLSERGPEYGEICLIYFYVDAAISTIYVLPQYISFLKNIAYYCLHLRRRG